MIADERHDLLEQLRAFSLRVALKQKAAGDDGNQECAE
jgi:hypothetical protein